MKNFPSALIKQKNTKEGLGNNLGTTLKNMGSKILKNVLGGEDALSASDINDTLTTGYEILELTHELDNLNINKHSKSINQQSAGDDIDKQLYRTNETVSLNSNLSNGISNFKDNYVYFEDPFIFSSSIFSIINNYKYILKTSVPSIQEYAKYDGNSSYQMAVAQSIVAPSLFNPYNGVSVLGITEHVPLMLHGNSDINTGDSVTNPLKGSKAFSGNVEDVTLSSALSPDLLETKDISDCTIKTLVELSKDPKNSQLGLATYRYADFMFCKDLGKIANNHLITLRKFPGPIGDNIFKGAYPDNIDNIEGIYPDIGRLVTWFGNDDNKLEDICKFNYNATWQEFHAEIQQKSSQQQDQGLIDKIANSFSPQNNQLIAKGFSGNTGLLGMAAAQLDLPIIGNDRMSQPYYDWELLSNYDQHKIYTPQNTIWDTHKYEGRLVFNQEITLTFRYVLRSYANINPKSAFLDLLANIMAVTYRRGSFWGGESKIFGPQGNNSVYKTAYKWGEQKIKDLGGMWAMFSNGFTLDELQGWFGNIMDMAGGLLNDAKSAAAGLYKGDNATAEERENADKVKKKVKDGIDLMKDTATKYGWMDAFKGMLKNQLGRPAMYAFNSLLTGEAVGPWHLTIGNPRNPIMSMGNMILIGSEIQQSGPLGIDDFPSEIKLTVTLKHGRPRDSVEIEKMYTKGRSGIYRPMNFIQLKDFKNNPNAFGDLFDNNGANKYENNKVIQMLLANL